MKERSKEYIRSSFKDMAPNMKTIVKGFYERLFEIKPAFKDMFKTEMDKQTEKFIHMIGLGVRGLDNEAELVPALSFLGRNHRTYGVKDEDYPVVKEALLYSMRKNLSDKYDEEFEKCWGEFYDYLAGVMMKAANR